MCSTYRVRDWDKHFESNKSRERDRCSFVCVPNKQDGMGLTRILAEPDGAAVYGIWQLIVGAVSRQRRPRAGWLTEDGHETGTPWAPADLALRWRRPEAEITRALALLCSTPIGWMECLPGARVVPAECPPGAQEGEGREGKEGKGNHPHARGSPSAEDRDRVAKSCDSWDGGHPAKWANFILKRCGYDVAMAEDVARRVRDGKWKPEQKAEFRIGAKVKEVRDLREAGAWSPSQPAKPASYYGEIRDEVLP